MKKSELLQALRRVAVGRRITVNWFRHQIVEVVKYREDDERWFNLVWRKKNGLEVALEVEKSKLTLWEQIRSLTDVHILKNPEIINYLGEEYHLKESGVARTTSKTLGKVIIRDKTLYWVYEADSGHRLAAEIWDSEVCFYYADGELPARAVWV